MAKRERSPNYPYLGLSEAIDHTQKLLERQKRALVSPDVAINSWGFKKPSGSSGRYLGALRQYGLLDDVEKRSEFLTWVSALFMGHKKNATKRFGKLLCGLKYFRIGE